MISITPYYREDRKCVVIRVFVNGTIAKVINTGIKVQKDQWDESERKIISHPNKKIFNQKLSAKVAELQAEVTKAELLGVILTQGRVKKIAEGSAVTTDFYKWSEQYISERYANIGTRKAQTVELHKLKSYSPSLQFGDIDARFLQKYENWLRAKYTGNTPWKALKFIRTMLYAAGKGIVHNNPFEAEEFRMPSYIQPLKDGLTIEELNRLEDLLKKDIPVMHKIVTAKFLFMCYTGLRISDAKKFSVDHHLHNQERIIITSQKTGVTTNLKLYDRLAGILEVIKTLPDKSLSDQRFNDWLKIIAAEEMADIRRLTLTSHVARHSFGCLLAEMGVSEEEAMKLMGHKRKENTRIYYQLRQPQIDKAADKLNGI